MRPSPDACRSRPLIARGRSRRGFSLVELLLAVFILAIGVISVAAIFPAAIYVQRQSTDDTIGPIVADNAFALLRQRLRQEDFGDLWGGSAFSAVNVGGLLPPPATSAATYALAGDWGWRRPASVIAQPSAVIGDETVSNGSILIFRRGAGPTSDVTFSELPWNPLATAVDTDPSGTGAGTFDLLQYAADPPAIVIRAEERVYPAGSVNPQYRWEVLFRRFQGRVLAAVFVYRVTRAGGEAGGLRIGPAATPFNPALPSFPVALGLADANLPFWTAGGADEDLSTIVDNAVVPGIAPGSPFKIEDPLYAWQAPGQWLLDQNNNVHRVLRGRRLPTDGAPVLARPIPLVPAIQAFPPVPGGAFDAARVVQALWYLPARDAAGNTITPIFIAVREL